MSVVIKPGKPYTFVYFNKKTGMPEVKHSFIKIEKDMQYVLWEGRHVVNTSMLVSRKSFNGDFGLVMSEQRWPAFDPRYLYRAKRSVKKQPIAENIHPLQPEQLITYQCIS